MIAVISCGPPSAGCGQSPTGIFYDTEIGGTGVNEMASLVPAAKADQAIASRAKSGQSAQGVFYGRQFFGRRPMDAAPADVTAGSVAA